MDALSVRRTFIDCVRDVGPASASRSSSAPPASMRLRSDSQNEVFESGEYITMLVSRARSIIHSKASAQNHKVVRKGPTHTDECDECGTTYHSTTCFECRDHRSLRDVIRTRGYQPFVPASPTQSPPTATASQAPHTCNDTGSPCPCAPPILEDRDTTLMLVDLPGKLSVDKLIESLDHHGFAGKYDLVYMPPRKGCRVEKRTKSNIGFCFVNFKSHEYAAAFASGSGEFTFHGFEKRSSVKRAKCQGFKPNLKIHSKLCLPGSLRTFTDLSPDQDQCGQ